MSPGPKAVVNSLAALVNSLAALLVLFTALLDPRISVAVAVVFLAALALFHLAGRPRGAAPER
jgi:hypothetical protein